MHTTHSSQTLQCRVYPSCFWVPTVEIIKSSWTFCPPRRPQPPIFEQRCRQRHKYLLTYLFHTCPLPLKGYGNLTTKTPLGKIATMLYALIGIPLMYLYMANIGGILASSFKYLYSKLCRFILLKVCNISVYFCVLLCIPSNQM